MFRRDLLRTVTVLTLVVAVNLSAFGQTGAAPATAPFGHASTPSLTAALSAIESKTESRRKELGIPGMSLAIIKDGQVVLAKGFGYKDLDRNIPVTADTQFAIGSATKAFTALSVLMTADEGKLSLDASPRTALPYFKIADPDTDRRITIRDLLTHSSGLNRTDLAMLTGKLKRAELIRVAGEAKPVAKLHEKFGYQNLMYAAAGEIVAEAQKQSWERFIAERIFAPLGMSNSNLSVKDMAKAKDRSLGYMYNSETKETRLLPYRDIGEVGPAGAINSSANDMAKWVQFVLSGGQVGGKRIVSEKGFTEWLTPRMKVNAAGKSQYALGWFVDAWNGKAVFHHGGNIDGFNSLVAMIPEDNVGFVMLTNVSSSTLGPELMPIVWENLVGKPAAEVTADASPEKEAGTYTLAAAGLNIEVAFNDNTLIATVPGQPPYTLEKVSPRKYKLSGAPAGFFITFKESELLLEQPHGNLTLTKKGASETKTSGAAARELIGKWESEVNSTPVEIKQDGDKVTLNMPGQQPYTLTDRGPEQFNLDPLPSTYWMKITRSADGKVAKFIVVQPEGEFAFIPPVQHAVDITLDDLIAKAVTASGGEANLRRLTTRVTTSTVNLEQEGIKASSTSWAKAPNKYATEGKMIALGKPIASTWEFFNGTEGEESYSFGPTQKFTGKRLEDLKVSGDFYNMLDWKSKYKNIKVTKKTKVGSEEAYAVEFEPASGSKFTEYYSTTTFRLLKRDGVIVSGASGTAVPYSVRFDDYREVDGIMLPFKQTSTTPGQGEVVTVVTSIKHNVKIDDKLFAPRNIIDY